MLKELDHKLERRGLKFAKYAANLELLAKHSTLY